jgi:LPS export ABC transporter protein LptC
VSSSHLFFAAAVLLALISPGCEEKIKPSVLTNVDSETMPQQESWDSDIVVSDSGRVRAIIHAGYFRVFDLTRQTEMSQGVRVRFYNPEGVVTTILTSAEGTVDEGTNNLQARKNVYVVSQDSAKLWTEVLYWDNARQLITTPDFVRIVTPREHLQGHGFESDQGLKNYRIFTVTGQALTQ